MHKFLTLLVVLLLANGCGEIQTGQIVTAYDARGVVVSTSESTALADPATEMYRAIRSVVENSARSITARADAIRTMAQPKATDSPEVAAWKTAMATMAIANIPDKTAEAIAAVPRATTGYDVALSGIGAVKDAALVGLPIWGWTESIRAMTATTSIPAISGDGNMVSISSGQSTAGNSIVPFAPEEEVDAAALE